MEHINAIVPTVALIISSIYLTTKREITSEDVVLSSIIVVLVSIFVAIRIMIIGA